MSPFENIGDAVASWINDLLNSEMAPLSPYVESVEWDGSRVVLKCEEEVSCRLEPGEYYEVSWYVHVYLNTIVYAVKSLSTSLDRVHERVDLDVLNCTDSELLKAIRQVCRCVPTDSPNQPDTPSLQDQHPNHPTFTEVV
jgi:hypothetical protein